MTIKERAHNFATDYAPFSDHTNLEIGYVKGAEEQKQIDIDKIERVINNVLCGYIIRNFHSGDSYSIDKLAKDVRKAMED